MTYLIIVLITLVLLIGFVLLTQYEAQHGVRFFGTRRAKLDAAVERIEFIVEHVDLAAFVQEEVRHAGTRLGHALVNLSLQAVRSVERLLTRLVRYLRMRQDGNIAPRETAREFVKTLSEFKDTLKAAHPGVPEIQKGS